MIHTRGSNVRGARIIANLNGSLDRSECQAQQAGLPFVGRNDDVPFEFVQGLDVWLDVRASPVHIRFDINVKAPR